MRDAGTEWLLDARQEAARLARREHRTVVDVAPERSGEPYRDGKRLTDTYQYRARCMCGWVGPTLPTTGEAGATGIAHRGEKIAEACCG